VKCERDVWGGESRWVDNGDVWCAVRHVDPHVLHAFNSVAT